MVGCEKNTVTIRLFKRLGSYIEAHHKFSTFKTISAGSEEHEDYITTMSEELSKTRKDILDSIRTEQMSLLDEYKEDIVELVSESYN